MVTSTLQNLTAGTQRRGGLVEMSTYILLIQMGDGFSLISHSFSAELAFISWFEMTEWIF